MGNVINGEGNRRFLSIKDPRRGRRLGIGLLAEAPWAGRDRNCFKVLHQPQHNGGQLRYRKGAAAPTKQSWPHLGLSLQASLKEGRLGAKETEDSKKDNVG